MKQSVVFAWLPVCTESGNVVWLKWVMRMTEECWGLNGLNTYHTYYDVF